MLRNKMPMIILPRGINPVVQPVVTPVSPMRFGMNLNGSMIGRIQNVKSGCSSCGRG